MNCDKSWFQSISEWDFCLGLPWRPWEWVSGKGGGKLLFLQVLLVRFDLLFLSMTKWNKLHFLISLFQFGTFICVLKLKYCEYELHRLNYCPNKTFITESDGNSRSQEISLIFPLPDLEKSFSISRSRLVQKNWDFHLNFLRKVNI